MICAVLLPSLQALQISVSFQAAISIALAFVFAALTLVCLFLLILGFPLECSASSSPEGPAHWAIISPLLASLRGGGLVLSTLLGR